MISYDWNFDSISPPILFHTSNTAGFIAPYSPQRQDSNKEVDMRDFDDSTDYSPTSPNPTSSLPRSGQHTGAANDGHAYGATNEWNETPLPNSFKVVLLGEGAVGKSSILLRYTEDKFNAHHASTIQAAFATKKLRLEASDMCAFQKEVELNLWDTAGQEKFHALGPIYYRGSQGAILVYDLTDPHSFERVKNWVRELDKMLGDTVVLFIAGNKLDLDAGERKMRAIAREEAETYAHSVGALFTECSAKEDINVREMFEQLTKEMLRKAEEKAQAEGSATHSNLRRHGSRRSIRVADDDDVNERKTRERRQRGGRCC